MRRINLLPPEERRRDIGGRLRSGVAGILLIAGALSVMVMVALYLFFLVRLGNEEDRIADLDTQIQQQNTRLAELAPFRDLQAQLDAKKPVADGIYRARFTWDEFLQGLSFVIPPSTALDTLTAEAAPINVQAPSEQPLNPPGAVTFTGVALPEYTNVADFVVQMNNLRFLANSQLNSAELDRETFAEPAINFEVAAELITEVGSEGNEVRLDGGAAPEEPATEEQDVGADQAAREGGGR
jgi:type IV pilus assembly protein PilN